MRPLSPRDGQPQPPDCCGQGHCHLAVRRTKGLGRGSEARTGRVSPHPCPRAWDSAHRLLLLQASLLQGSPSRARVAPAPRACPTRPLSLGPNPQASPPRPPSWPPPPGLPPQDSCQAVAPALATTPSLLTQDGACLLLGCGASQASQRVGGALGSSRASHPVKRSPPSCPGPPEAAGLARAGRAGGTVGRFWCLAEPQAECRPVPAGCWVPLCWVCRAGGPR